MWKEFFYYTKRERWAIGVLTAFILVVQVLLWTADRWVKWLPQPMQQRYVVQKEAKADRESAFREKTEQQGSPERVGRNGYSKTASVPIVLRTFDPNRADSMTLLQLGLKSYIVRNILKYRRKGGSFRKSADFSRIYGLAPEQYALLEPYIQIASVSSASEVYSSSSGAVPSLSARLSSSPAEGHVPESGMAYSSPNPTEQNPSIVELNSADTTLLRQFRGVGSITAARVVRYRTQLGGFYSLKQLDEIKGIYPETLERLKVMFKADPSGIVPLDVNKASLEKLRAHPYLSFYQAKVIVELRKARGKICSIQELEGFPEFTDEDLDRLKWYLKF